MADGLMRYLVRISHEHPLVTLGWLTSVTLFTVSTLLLPGLVGSFSESASQGSDTSLIIRVSFVVLLSAASRSAGRYFARQFTEHAVYVMRVKLGAAALGQIEHDRGVSAGQWSSIAAADVKRVRELIADLFARGGMGFTVGAVAIVIFVCSHPLLSTAAFGVVAGVVGIALFSKTVIDRHAARAISLDSSLTNYFATIARCRESIVGNGSSRIAAQSLNRLATESRLANVRVDRLESLIEPVFSILLYGSVALAAGSAVQGSAGGSMALSDTISEFMWLFVALPNLLDVMLTIGTISSSNGSVKTVRSAGGFNRLVPSSPVAIPSGRWEGPLGLELLSGETISSGLVTLVGPSGSGKTTTLRQLVGVPTHVAMGLKLAGLTQTELSDSLTAGCAYVPQQLEVSDGTLLGLGRDLFGLNDRLGWIDSARANMTALGLPPSLGAGMGYIGGASGGELTRIFIAVALSSRRQVMVLDEPTSSLDSSSTQLVTNALKAHAVSGLVIISSHDPEVIAVSDYVLSVELWDNHR